MTEVPAVYPTLLYRDAQAAVRQLAEAFGFHRDAVYEDEEGRVVHAELSFGNGTVMLGTRGTGDTFDTAMAGGGPAGVHVVVADPDAHHARAREAGAEILTEPADQPYGARDYLARDLEGNVWSFGTYAPGRAG
ncbi:VOC family protein [Streptomyces sp. JJ36]|uniref:VOC family protein n=1 Tax=Streptomyces sp. JJ36 TaxID=2736645 RepID=UPI001F190B49|nr:VOC family protein [Streptomyces sp. JJ36]MCF6526292.1 VOC family protein [Streptomyces sp. JJ36]